MAIPDIELGKMKKKQELDGYKSSRFNVFSEGKEGQLLLLNTYSNKMVRFSSDSKHLVRDLLKHPDRAMKDSKLFEFMYDRGFIISNSVDEFRRAEMRHQETITQEGTLSLIIMPNEDCNFRCVYCYESFAKNFMNESTQEGIINYLRKNIRQYSRLQIEWFGGEPLTAVPIIEKLSSEMIRICQENKVQYAATMTTNGYNLSLEVFRKMQEYMVFGYQITLDGLAETHNQTRVGREGNDTFDQIVSNLKAIRDNVKRNTFSIVVRTNVTRNIYEKLEHYFEFFNQEFGNDHRFICKMSKTGDWGGESVRSLENQFCTSKDIVSVLKNALEHKIPVWNAYEDQLHDSVCYAAKRNNYVIGSDGIIYKCTVALSDENNQVGLLTQDGNMYIDKDKFSLWVTGHESSDEGCKKCFFRPSCQGASCPYIRIHTGEAPCPDIKKYIKDYMRIVTAQSKNVEDCELDYIKTM